MQARGTKANPQQTRQPRKIQLLKVHSSNICGEGVPNRPKSGLGSSFVQIHRKTGALGLTVYKSKWSSWWSISLITSRFMHMHMQCFGYLWEGTLWRKSPSLSCFACFLFLKPLYVIIFGGGIGLLSRAKGCLLRQVPHSFGKLGPGD